MKVPNQMIAIVAIVGLCATVACGRRSPVSPDVGRPAGAASTAGDGSASADASERAQPSIFAAACDINGALTDFRTALGALNPNVPGEVGDTGGRREVNWDAVPPGFTNTLTFPGDFFNQNFSPRARGVVFSDVDQLGSASIKLIGANGNSLGVYLAPACPEGFSFVAVKFPSEIVAAVDIRSGHGPLGADAADQSDRDHGPARDLVVMDDFVYGEPRAVR